MRPSVLVFAAALTPALAAPAPTQQKCTNPQKRPEWRELSEAGQQSYIDAVLCLKTKPSRLGLDTTLYDDFPYVHFNLSLDSM
jgi:tyrosinase